MVSDHMIALRGNLTPVCDQFTIYHISINAQPRG